MYQVAGEFGFELRVCRWAELAWHPLARDTPAIVARQLGTRRRRWDTVVIEVEPEAFEARLQLSPNGVDSDLLHVLRHAPEDWTWYREALPEPEYPWRYVRAAVHRAASRDLIEERKKNGRIQLRRLRPYPDWVRRIIAIENKPDLDASAARTLPDQLSHDIRAGLVDEVWVATATTEDRVPPALLADIPIEAGVVTLDFTPGVRRDAGEVVWRPTRLEPDCEPSRRTELAERAYDSGWRSFPTTMRPDCRAFQLRHQGRGVVPFCAAKGREQTTAECSGDCQKFSPEPPPWRTKGPPIEGGPGKGIERLLQSRRERARSRQTTPERD